MTGAVDLDVQTGSGDITVRTGDSTKVEIHAKIHGSGWGDVEQRIHEIENNPPIEQSGNTIRDRPHRKPRLEAQYFDQLRVDCADTNEAAV